MSTLSEPRHHNAAPGITPEPGGAATPDPDLELDRHIHRQAVASLFGLLPDPPDNSPASLHARNEAAIARVSELHPANADEIDIALHYVLARAHALDVMHALRAAPADDKRRDKLLRQYALMERTAQADRRLLAQVQAARRKREALPGGTDAAAWSAYVTRRRLQQAAGQGAGQGANPRGRPGADPPESPPAGNPPPALDSPPAGNPLPAGNPPPALDPVRHAAPSSLALPPAKAGDTRPAAAPPPPAPQPRPGPTPGDMLVAFVTAAMAAPGPDPRRDLAAEADRYAIAHPAQARFIRQTGEPPAANPPDEDLIFAIVAGDTPTLRALDSPRAAAA